MSNNYTLGRGEIHFGQYRTGTQVPRGERYLGNSPELGFSAEQENLDHYNSDRGVRIKDESVILQLDYNGSFITDNISPQNLAMFFLGTQTLESTAGSTADTESFVDVELGTSYQLGTSTTQPSGVRDVENVALTVGATPLVIDVDYTIDMALGRFTLLDTATVVADTDTVDVTYDVKASTRQRIISKSDTIEGSLRFLAYNPAGDDIDYFMPWVKITPSGDFQLKSDEWQQLPFDLEVLKKGTLESIYMDGRAYVPA